MPAARPDRQRRGGQRFSPIPSRVRRADSLRDLPLASPVLVAPNDLDATSWASCEFPVMGDATFVLTVALSLITYYLLERPAHALGPAAGQSSALTGGHPDRGAVPHGFI